jgi:hypothetical protein
MTPQLRLLRYFSLHPEWQTLVRKELKGKDPSSLLWHTPEVPFLNKLFYSSLGNHCQTIVYKD